MVLGRVLGATSVGLVILAGAAFAGPYTFEMGADSWIDTSGTVGALEMWASVYNSVQFEEFTLSAGESYTFLFARMGTYESWVNPDDLVPGSVEAHVDFDVPLLTRSVEGETVGFSGLWSFNQGWHLVWDDPVEVDFEHDGIGGTFWLELSDASLVNGWWSGPNGLCGNSYADIWATVTLVDSYVVPEPATMSLLGLGLAGLAIVRMRRRT